MIIILYTKSGCPWCIEVVELLRKKNIPFEERNVTANAKFFKEMVEKSGQTLAPTLDIDGEILKDSDVGQVAEYMRKKAIPGFV